MKTWTTILAVAMTGAMAAGPALAQGAGKPEGAPPSTGVSPAPSAAPETGKAGGDAMKAGKAAGTAEQVKAVQQALKDKGFDPGEVDGKMGPKTQAALRDFQQKEGLKATGRLDTETMAKLGVEKTSGAAPAPSASPGTDAGAKKDAETKK